MIDAREMLAGLLTAVALAACGPGDVAASSELGSGGETGSETSPSSTSGFPDLPPPEPDCLAAGGELALTTGPMQLAGQDDPAYFEPTDLEATPTGLLALWRAPDPASESSYPRAWAQRLDASGQPTDEPAVIFSRGVALGPRAHPVDGGFMLSFCGEWGLEYRVASIAIDALGQAIGAEQLRSPNDRKCGLISHAPHGAWTGARHLTTWRDNSSGPLPGFELLVDSFDDAGSSAGWTQLQDDGDGYPEPRVVVSSEAAFVVSADAAGEGIALHRFDALGHHLPDQGIELELPAEHGRGDMALAANAEGMVLWMAERDAPHRSLRWHLDPSGALLEGPIEQSAPEPGRHYAEFELSPRSGGFALAATVRGSDQPNALALAWLDSSGAPLAEVEISDPQLGYFWPSLAQRGESSFVLFASTRDEFDGFDVQLAEFGCSP